jgi:hypothetical protein
MKFPFQEWSEGLKPSTVIILVTRGGARGSPGTEEIEAGGIRLRFFMVLQNFADFYRVETLAKHHPRNDLTDLAFFFKKLCSYTI